MTIRFELPTQKENILREEAKQHGMKISDYARMLVEQNLFPSSLNKPNKPLVKGMFSELGRFNETDFKCAEWKKKRL